MKEFKHESFEYEKDIQKVMLPTNRVVCPSCNGDGMVSRTDIDSSLIFDSCEADGDHEGMERVRNGEYMKRCDTCNGRNVIDEFDMEFFEEFYPKEFKIYEDWIISEIEDRRYAENERKYCGYY